MEAELRAQIRQLTQAAVERESSFGDKVQSTVQEVEAAFDQLQGTTQALAQKDSQAQGLSESPISQTETVNQVSIYLL